MKFNISDPQSGGNKRIEVDEEKNFRPFFDRRMGQEINGDLMGEDYKGYIFRITGGNDKQGFTMKQGILKNGRSRVLFKRQGTTYRPRRTGERKRKSVRGCICGPDLSVIALRIIVKGEKDIAGVTDIELPNRLGRKRKNRICDAFALERKTDDVRKYVVRRKIEKGDKTMYKAPHIQRMVTETRLRRKFRIRRDKIRAVKASNDAAVAYEKLLKEYAAEKTRAHRVATGKSADKVIQERPRV